MRQRVVGLGSALGAPPLHERNRRRPTRLRLRGRSRSGADCGPRTRRRRRRRRRREPRRGAKLKGPTGDERKVSLVVAIVVAAALLALVATLVGDAKRVCDTSGGCGGRGGVAAADNDEDNKSRAHLRRYASGAEDTERRPAGELRCPLWPVASRKPALARARARARTRSVAPQVAAALRTTAAKLRRLPVRAEPLETARARLPPATAAVAAAT